MRFSNALLSREDFKAIEKFAVVLWSGILITSPTLIISRSIISGLASINSCLEDILPSAISLSAI